METLATQIIVNPLKQLRKLTISGFTTSNGKPCKDITLSYQCFGKPLGTAPTILVNHALTGNSNVAGYTGWWRSIIGEEKIIDTNKFTILAFNIPGNGFDSFVIENYKDFITRDIANIFLEGLKKLQVKQLFALIGGSLGGGIAWEMAVINPNITQHLIPVATDWKSTDWLIANCQIQEQILLNSSQPVHDARMHAMLCYRTPESFKERFNRTVNLEADVFNIESWLLHHGEKLQERFQLSAYQLMNQLLKTIDVTRKGTESLSKLTDINASIHIVAVNSDLFFTSEENQETYEFLSKTKKDVAYHEIQSIHGHDAFLIEYKQLETILKPIFDTSVKLKVTNINKKPKKVANLVVFGCGNVGEALVNQLLESQKTQLKKQNLLLNIIAVSNSKRFVFNADGLTNKWKDELYNSTEESDIPNKLIKLIKAQKLSNVIAIDNTADICFTNNYIPFVNAGYDLVSSNKIANTISFDFYEELRIHLKKNNKTYLYETNVGAGLPVVDTINLLHEAGENITRIRGVFSGSLSYLFNTFSSEETTFSKVLQQAIDKGFTEPDPREDLCGNDVARKLLILARELDLKNELSDVNIQNLVPEVLQDIPKDEFLERLSELDDTYKTLRQNLKEDEVLRYVGDLHGDLFQEKGLLDVKLVPVPKTSSLGALKGSDAIFEIFTESYGENPIVIQGAGAGAKVTARGVLGDILRIARKY